jgi:lantibiotic modifying enzyme
VDLALTRIELLAGAAPGTDVVDGLAGAILATLAIAGRDGGSDRVGRAGTDRARPDAGTDRAIGLAQRLGDRLIVLGPTASGLGGFSHGTAGVAAALMRLWAVTGDDRYAEAGRQALDFDRALFRPASGNWADLRKDGIFSMNWCHGAPGIGLSRVLIREAMPDDGPVEGVDDEIRIALRTTLARGFGRNHSLCHGDLGNLELPLLLGGEVADVADITAGILYDAREHGWQCANPHGIESPELMTGLSGMGYQLLRLASPQTVPSLLTLAAPR